MIDGPGATARTFVALTLDPQLAERVLAAVEQALDSGDARRHFRLPPADGLHLTLFFLGQLERGLLTRVQAELGTRLTGLAAPRLTLEATGAFPSRTRERVLWVGVGERASPGLLGTCRSAVLSALSAAGIDTRPEEQRPFRPHLTVARLREAQTRENRVRVPSTFYQLAFDDSWTPYQVTLFESELGRGPARHLPRARFALRET